MNLNKYNMAKKNISENDLLSFGFEKMDVEGLGNYFYTREFGGINLTASTLNDLNTSGGGWIVCFIDYPENEITNLDEFKEKFTILVKANEIVLSL